MNTLKSLFAVALMLAALCTLTPVANAQLNTMTSTTLSAAVSGPSTGSTGAARYPSTIALTSVSGISPYPQNPVSTSAIGTPSGGNFLLYVDKEAMLVLGVNSTLNTVSVSRGYMGTAAQAHLSGATAYYGVADWFGNYGAWNSFGPSGACTVSVQKVLPWIQIATGDVFNCIASSSGASTGVWTRQTTDGYFFVSPANCGATAVTTAFSGSLGLTAAATGNLVNSFTTNTTAGTIELTCLINLPSRLTAGRGVTLTGVSLLYGVQTTALSSIATATAKSITYPASTSGGAAAAGTVATAGGTLAVTPATLQLATTTTGLCYNEKLTFGTPIQAVTNLVSYAIDQVFTTAGSAATTLQVCGLQVFYNINN